MTLTLMPLFASKSATSLLMVVSIGFGDSRVIWVCACAPDAAPRITPRTASNTPRYFMAVTIRRSVSIVNGRQNENSRAFPPGCHGRKPEGFRLPSTDYRLPATDYQLPTTGWLEVELHAELQDARST